MDYQKILKFWFKEMDQALWFKKDEDFDAYLRQHFGSVWQAASKGELAHWRRNIEGRLAEILILDQFSRNLFRDLPTSFSCDGMALVLAQEAVSSGQVGQLSKTQRGFLYLPFMHSESALIHQQALVLYTELGDELQLDYELRHKAIIDRFGRYPHRNHILGRVSSAEEQAFLLQTGSAF
ncbi:putative transmembrane protein [Yersinia frederiksenii]|nr:putative transmembrane protein [Yersinia frederiksenii]CNM00460.1 putative transmembrane protein [Yersinia frederiksenii]